MGTAAYSQLISASSSPVTVLFLYPNVSTPHVPLYGPNFILPLTGVNGSSSLGSRIRGNSRSQSMNCLRQVLLKACIPSFPIARQSSAALREFLKFDLLQAKMDLYSVLTETLDHALYLIDIFGVPNFQGFVNDAARVMHVLMLQLKLVC